jgi:hypothetical protein
MQVNKDVACGEPLLSHLWLAFYLDCASILPSYFAFYLLLCLFALKGQNKKGQKS